MLNKKTGKVKLTKTLPAKTQNYENPENPILNNDFFLLFHIR